jgi:RNA polymerase sigma factor (sigma-70 family)
VAEYSPGLSEFLRRAGKHRLLTAQEERDLARRIAQGDDAARHALVLANVRLAVDVAAKFRGRGIEFEDLVQAALIGLDVAARKFDPERRVRFSTYAWNWVFQNCQRTCQRSEIIHVSDITKRIRLSHHNDPDLTEEQLAAKHKTSIESVRRALQSARVTASLDQPADSDRHQAQRYELTPDVHADDPADVSEGSEWVRKLVDKLKDDERHVIELTFGLNGYAGREHTSAEVAVIMGTTERKADELRRSGLRRLRRLASS